ncbi:hypothetical protein KAX06_00070 [candidate division WOR-3 bacterium]|nr:hypothetical protein [candidate division WOR-3 bacterium]MCK4333164.1 hypothetical protein [candidate division WOR-3 bacterium]
MIYGNWYCRSYDWSLELAGDGERVSEEEGGELLDAWITGFREDQAGFKEKLGEWTAARFIVTLKF